MNTKQLHYFLLCVQKGSISGAAKELDLAQPAISQQLTNLEHELRVTLFERDFRGVHLTEQGRIFAKHAQIIFNQIDLARSEIDASKSLSATTIAIGMSQAICNVIAVPLQKAIEEKLPQVELVLSTGPSHMIKTSLISGEIDIALTYEDEVINKEMRCRALIQEDMFLVLASRKLNDKYTQLRTLSSIAFKDLSAYEIIVPHEMDALNLMLLKYEKTAGIKLQRRATFGQLMTNLHYIVDGQGLAILPSSAVYHLENSGQLKTLTITQPQMSRKVIIASPKDTPEQPATLAVIQVIENVTQQAHRAGRWRGKLLAGTSKPEFESIKPPPNTPPSECHAASLA